MATRKVADLPVQERDVVDGSWDKKRNPIDRIIIHTTVGSAESAANWFNNPNRKELTSAHYIVTLEGKYIHLVDEDNVAYHAGSYEMNQRSIGIEHEDNNQPLQPRSDALYAASARLVKDIADFYDIPLDRQHILKHSEVSKTPCPHSLDIDRIIREAKQLDVALVNTDFPPKVRVLPKKGMRVRREAIITSDNIIKTIDKGVELVVIGRVEGENIEGNNVWYKLDGGGYMWAGGVEAVGAVAAKPEQPKEEKKEPVKTKEEVLIEQVNKLAEDLKRVRGERGAVTQEYKKAVEVIKQIAQIATEFLQQPDPTPEPVKPGIFDGLLKFLRLKKE